MKKKKTKFVENLLDNIQYYCWRKTFRRLIPKYHDRTIFTKFFWRTLWDRLTKGFDETCTWSLDYSLAKMIAPRLEMFSRFGTFAIPFKIENLVRARFIEQGYTYDANKGKFVEKDVQDKFWADCETEWAWLIRIMQYGFQDIVDENDDWDEWKDKYSINIKLLQGKLNAAKSESARKKIWDSYGFWREYRAGIKPIAEDFSTLLRKKALQLFAEYFQSLWW